MVKVILKETIQSLGIIGSEVKVKDGYARNFLLPQNKAVLSTESNRKMLSLQKVKFDLQIAKERKLAEEMAERIKEVSCTIPARVSDEDRLYGSVTVRDILQALVKQGLEIDKRMILLPEPIKKLGAYKVPIRIYKGVKPEISVEVVPE